MRPTCYRRGDIASRKEKQEKFFSSAPGDRPSFALVVVFHSVDPSVLVGVCTSRWSVFDDNDGDSSVSDMMTIVMMVMTIG